MSGIAKTVPHFLLGAWLLLSLVALPAAAVVPPAEWADPSYPVDGHPEITVEDILKAAQGSKAMHSFPCVGDSDSAFGSAGRLQGLNAKVWGYAGPVVYSNPTGESWVRSFYEATLGRAALDTTVSTGLIFTDGFETGDTTAWSHSAL